ncbi:MAG: hypothetical protein ACRESE_09205 [Gammaproteobacteria bacterium]
MSEQHDPLTKTVFAAVDNLAEHATAEKYLAGLGETVIAPLRVYLAQPPTVIPQTRCFAVAMLARLDSIAATAVLHEVLHQYPLTELSAPVAQAEFVVKNDVVAGLAQRHYPDLATDIGFALWHERLPAAATAAGRLRIVSLAPALAILLDDDTLAAVASEALQKLGQAGTDALLAALQIRLEAPQENVRNRLALIRVLLALGETRQTPSSAALVQALRQSHAGVRAAAAWVAWRVQARPGMRRALLHGALAPIAGLSGVCREALEAAAWPECAAISCLRRGWESDIYGDKIPIEPVAQAWMIARTLASTGDIHAAIQIFTGSPDNPFWHVLERGFIRDLDTLRCLFHHGDARLRAAAVRALPYCGSAQAMSFAISASTDQDRVVRRNAHRALLHWPNPAAALHSLAQRLPQGWRLSGLIAGLVLRVLWR